jgi:hypothetical protein
LTCHLQIDADPDPGHGKIDSVQKFKNYETCLVIFFDVAASGCRPSGARPRKSRPSSSETGKKYRTSGKERLLELTFG